MKSSKTHSAEEAIQNFDFNTQNKAIWINSSSIQAYINFISKNDLTFSKGNKHFLHVIISYLFERSLLDTSDSNYLCSDLAEFSKTFENHKIGASTANISNKLNALHEMGVFHLVTVDISKPHQKPTYKRVFAFNELIDLAKFIKAKEEDNEEINLTFDSSDDPQAPPAKTRKRAERKEKFISSINKQPYLEQNFSTSIDEAVKESYIYKTFILLTPCLRMSSQHNKNVLQSTRTLNGRTKVDMTAQNHNEHGICTIGDLQTINIVISLCIYIIQSYIELKLPLHNDFLIDITDLARLKGVKPVGGNRKTIADSLNRLYFTQYTIDIKGNNEDKFKISEIIDIPGMDHNNLRFITEYNTDLEIDPDDSKKKTPRWIRLSLNQRTYQRIVERELNRHEAIEHNIIKDIETPVLFKAPKDLMLYSNGLVHLLIQHLNVKIGRELNHQIEISNQTFHREMAASSKKATFDKLLHQAFKTLYEKNSRKQWNESGINYITTLGYHMTVQVSNKTIERGFFSRDRTDPITGDNSAHKVIKKRKRKAYAAQSKKAPQGLMDNNLIFEF